MKRKKMIFAVVLATLALLAAVVVLAAPAYGDDFEAYANGTVMQGVGGWKGWDNSPAAAGTASNVQAHSGSISMAAGPAADAVHEFTGFNSGVYDIIAWTYLPSATTGQQYFIVLNTYADGGTNNWSAQVLLDAAADTVTADMNVTSGGTATTVEDQWVELRINVDLTSDVQTLYYNGVQFAAASWTGGVSGSGAANIGAIDLFGNGASTMYYDDIAIVPANRAITVNKTVSTDGSCGASSTINAPYNSDVTYCYQITNSGNLTYTSHMVMDDQLGMVLPMTNLALNPGASYQFTVTTPFNQNSVTNVMTWTAYFAGMSVATNGSASATVNGQPTDVSLTDFGGNGSSAWILSVATLGVLGLLAGAMVVRRRQQG